MNTEYILDLISLKENTKHLKAKEEEALKTYEKSPPIKNPSGKLLLSYFKAEKIHRIEGLKMKLFYIEEFIKLNQEEK